MKNVIHFTHCLGFFVLMLAKVLRFHSSMVLELRAPAAGALPRTQLSEPLSLKVFHHPSCPVSMQYAYGPAKKSVACMMLVKWILICYLHNTIE